MSYTSLKGFDDLSDKSTSDIIGDNIIQFLDWGFINKGGIVNITTPTSGLYAGDKSILKPRDDPRFDEGQVWSSFVKGWIWESGLSNSQPISISGVTVNDIFYTKDDTQYGHYYDYPNGRVIFNSGLPLSSSVKLNYSYRYIQVVNDREYDYFRRVQEEAYRVDGEHFNQYGSGNWDILSDNTIQGPTISVESLPINRTSPYSLGRGMRWGNNTLKCYILTEDYATNVKIADILVDQKEKTLYAFDSNLIAESGDFPLDYKGMVKDAAKTYPRLVDESVNGGYRYNKIYIKDADSQPVQQIGNIFLSTVKLNTEILLSKL